MDYKTKGVCSQKIHFDIEGNKVKNVSFVGGCNGNLQGISRLIEGMDVDEAIRRIDKNELKQTLDIAKALKEATGK